MGEKMKDKVWTGVLYGVSVFIVILLLALLGYIVLHGLNAFNPHFLIW